ncbi:hypothetical protein [Hymenobacter sp. BT559]|uniref:hypothetical protein n=1 Tax=Hymenobacter sp. BT559 TaxID=2795729 RepID=UPI0018EDEDE0|nr:hypothetical protein [Hymenobacter sp. BT559]MBJ6142840.1 hypothetical protein [Hymenobacter sp. BT559]
MTRALSYSLLSLLLVGATACHEAATIPQTEFFVQATRNATPWTATATATHSKASQQFYLVGQTGDAAKAEALSLGFALPAAPQLAPVQALPAAWRVSVGYDALIDSYATADEAGLPRLEITRLDTVNKVVEGRFEATLMREKQWTTKPEPMTLEKGSFRAHYTEVP